MFEKILTRAHEVSKVVPPRSKERVFLQFLSELGELGEEINIAMGESKKSPGVDGVVGETADVLNCLADLCYVSRDGNVQGFVTAVSGFEVLNWESSEISLDSARSMFFDALIDLDVFLAAIKSPVDEFSAEIVANFMEACLMLAKASHLDLTFEEFLQIYDVKCKKWEASA